MLGLFLRQKRLIEGQRRIIADLRNQLDLKNKIIATIDENCKVILRHNKELQSENHNLQAVLHLKDCLTANREGN